MHLAAAYSCNDSDIYFKMKLPALYISGGSHTSLTPCINNNYGELSEITRMNLNYNKYNQCHRLQESGVK